MSDNHMGCPGGKEARKDVNWKSLMMPAILNIQKKKGERLEAFSSRPLVG
jgi:hypothetical protein